MADPVMVVEHGAVRTKKSPLRPLLTHDATPGPVEADDRSYATPESLFMEHYEPLARALTLITHDSDVARDVVQEAFARLCREWPTVSGYRHQAAWVRKVAVNVARDQLRRRGRHEDLFPFLAEEGMDPAPRGMPTADPPVEGNPELWKAVQGLPERQRTAIGLFYVADLSVAEVSAAMGISQGAVNRHLNRARSSLKRKMGA